MTTDVDKLVDGLIAEQKRLDEQTRLASQEIVDGQCSTQHYKSASPSEQIEELRRFAAAWIGTAMQESRNADYCREGRDEALKALARHDGRSWCAVCGHDNDECKDKTPDCLGAKARKLFPPFPWGVWDALRCEFREENGKRLAFSSAEKAYGWIGDRNLSAKLLPPEE
jgi:hypothetical protein